MKPFTASLSGNSRSIAANGRFLSRHHLSRLSPIHQRAVPLPDHEGVAATILFEAVMQVRQFTC